MAARLTLALVLAAAGLIELAITGASSPAWVAAAVLLASLPLAWRDRLPLLPVVAAAAGVALATAFTSAEDLPIFLWIAVGAGMFSAGEYGSDRELLAAAVIGPVTYTVMGLIEEDLDSAVFGGLITLAAAGVGRAVRVMGYESETLEARIGALEEDQERHAREAVAAERARIARELHDVIGHSISVMGVQAGAVRRVLPAELQEERETLLSVERTGRDAVTEMRRLLDLLRSADDAPSNALPTLAYVPQLVADMRHAGLALELKVDGDLDDLPPGRALAAYRIVQEALTNALKHSPEARVRVCIRRTPEQVEVDVIQEAGGAMNGSGDTSGGHGLVGMHERVAMYGGRLAAGPGPGGGFEVRAALPLQAGTG
jgi:signal transduction histidine kinase